MARPSATTAALLFLLVSLLAVAHGRPLEAEPATDAESAAAVAVSDDDNGPPKPELPAASDETGPPNPTLPAEVVLPVPAEQQKHGFLRLPSHRFFHRHRPCRHGPFHRHLWWARHHGAFGDEAPRWFHHRLHVELPSHLRVLPAGEARETEEVMKAVAEPDPDRSLPDRDGEGEEVAARTEPSSFGDADGGAAAHEDEGAAVRAWRKEMQRRWFHHHGMRFHLHRHHDVEEEGHEQEEAGEGMKRFHHHRHHDHDEDEEGHMMRKRFRRAEHDANDSDDEDDEVEELVRRFRKAIMRRRFGGHGRRFHHRHRHHFGHRHSEEAEKADAQEDGGVVSWIKGLMNRF